jgi:predicted nicotinamide N-methyase
MEVNIVEANTYIDSPPLCPEIKLRFLREDAPIKAKAPVWRGKPHLFDWEGPRPYWAFAWGGGQALARFILDHPAYIRGRRVVDFGAGSGIAGIAATLSGAALVIATDVDPIAIRAVQTNAALNHVFIGIMCEDISKKRRQNWDVLLAGDVFSTGGNPDWLLPWARRNRLILIGEPPFRGFPKEHLRLLENYSVRTFPDFEHPDVKEACVYVLGPNRKARITGSFKHLSSSSKEGRG